MKVLIAYFSLTGKTQKMAEYIAEGVRIGGQQAQVKKLAAIKNAEDLTGYDGYILGCPTYHRDMTESMKKFLYFDSDIIAITSLISEMRFCWI